jgi:hypothetical protein
MGLVYLGRDEELVADAPLLCPLADEWPQESSESRDYVVSQFLQLFGFKYSVSF